MARFFLDEDVPNKVASELRAKGHDVITTPEAGRKGMTDEQQLAFAKEQDRIIVTNNRDDFRDLHKAGHEHAGIIAGTQNKPEAFAAHIDAIVAEMGDMKNRLVRANKDHYTTQGQGLAYNDVQRMEYEQPVTASAKEEAARIIRRLQENSREAETEGGSPPAPPRSSGRSK